MDDPSLEEMTKAAIRMLANKEKGFVVFIEEVSNCPVSTPEYDSLLSPQGRIDHGHHKNEAGRALQQTLELDKAVTAALDLVDLEVSFSFE